MDKTGTITENKLSVKELLVPDETTLENAFKLTSAYVNAVRDSSSTVASIKIFLDAKKLEDRKTSPTEVLAFSSWRQYGAVRMLSNGKEITVFAGPPQIFLSHIQNKEEREWLIKSLNAKETSGERVLCLMTRNTSLPLDTLEGAELHVLGVVAFFNVFRVGVKESIQFFQERGTILRIISGDNPSTVKAVATQAGINCSEKMITSEEMKGWSENDFIQKSPNYTIFAGVLPEQKKMIIDGLKKNGFTAMIGDGVNDALAIKSADLGIAMIDGVPAVRGLASVVLTNNSFAALPDGVRLADTIIRYTELFTSMFLNQTLLGLFFFIALSVFGYTFPFTPFNLTLINYFTIGIPGILISYWIIWPKRIMSQIDSGAFLDKVLPIAALSAAVQAIILTGLFFFFTLYLGLLIPNTLLVFSFILLSLSFFFFIPKTFIQGVNRTQVAQLIGLSSGEVAILFVIFNSETLMNFFNVSKQVLSLATLTLLFLFTILVFIVQFFIVDYFTLHQRTIP